MNEKGYDLFPDVKGMDSSTERQLHRLLSGDLGVERV